MPPRGRQQKRKTWVAGDAPSKKRDVKDTPSPRISPPPRRIAASPAAYTHRVSPPSPPPQRMAVSPPRSPTPPPPTPPPPPQVTPPPPPPSRPSEPQQYALFIEALDRFKEFEKWFEGKWQDMYKGYEVYDPLAYKEVWGDFQKAVSQLKEGIRDACRGEGSEEEEKEEVKSPRVETGTQTEAAAPARKEDVEKGSRAEAGTQTEFKKKEEADAPATKKNVNKVPSVPRSSATQANKKTKTKARAVVVHGISVFKSLVSVRQEVERRGKKKDNVIGARWLLGRERRVGKKESSVVIYFEREVEVDGFCKIGNRRHRASVYEWDRGGKGRGG